MIKKIKIASVLILFAVITSCSMWDDVDKNSLFEIPVADFAVIYNSAPNPARWDGILDFQKNDASKNPATMNAINLVKIATNNEKTKLFFYLDVNGNISSGFYVILISNDYNCDGYKLYFTISTGSSAIFYNICSTNPQLPSAWYSMTGENYTKLEISVDLATAGIVLNDNILISVFSTNLPSPPSVPNSNIGSSTNARWAKLR